MKYLIMLLAALPAPAAHNNPQKKQEHPFLQYPVSSVAIYGGTAGCEHYSHDWMRLERLNDTAMASWSWFTDHNEDEKDYKHEMKADARVLESVLGTVLSDSGICPGMEDFNITETDRRNYFELLKEMDIDPVLYYDHKTKRDYSIYQGITAILDTMGKASLQRVLMQKEYRSSTTYYWFRTILVNSNNDTLQIGRNYYCDGRAWHLPWEVKYKGKTFVSYSLDYSRFLAGILPTKFMEAEMFDNKYLILQVADYFYRSKYYKR